MAVQPSQAPLKRPTMADVAERAGVSRTLVSTIFRGIPGASAKTRERVMKAADELGYRPDVAAQMLRRTRSRNLGVLFTSRHAFDLEFIEELYPAAEKYGYHLVLGAMTATRDEYKAVEELLGYHSEALILLGPDLDAKQLNALAASVPVIEVARVVKRAKIDVVRTDDESGVGQAVDHLVGFGHRRIIHIDGGHMPSATERRTGYEKAMASHGLADNVKVIPGDYTEESGAAAAAEILTWGDRPTAVIAGNDRCALGLLDTLRRGGVRVPEDISVVGYDDSRLARLSFVDLTSVRQDVRRMAELAVLAASQRLDENRTETQSFVLEPTLTVRTSTGPAPA
ncbi:LacI family DNA-binding transcriptional regulator [Arthrobacter sp. NPDC056727]|uniref:LacI family DNA-binding transcriptional regulator n=1 Tax=Arthrobacter sp. NPDC056727 TaxID=3345927 RepID=UPI00366DC0CA